MIGGSGQGADDVQLTFMGVVPDATYPWMVCPAQTVAGTTRTTSVPRFHAAASVLKPSDAISPNDSANLRPTNFNMVFPPTGKAVHPRRFRPPRADPSASGAHRHVLRGLGSLVVATLSASVR